MDTTEPAAAAPSARATQADWQPITATQPPLLVDVLVTAELLGVPATFTAYRRRTPEGADEWCVTGAGDETLTGVYAWAPEPTPAPLSMRAPATSEALPVGARGESLVVQV
ncbi:MAG TPA: hypothetical protein VFG73_02455 [Rhodanobacteraceae bacterium]|nr:hypothetical protein [Rhodanobacteraceae bacterium]